MTETVVKKNLLVGGLISSIQLKKRCELSIQVVEEPNINYPTKKMQIIIHSGQLHQVTDPMAKIMQIIKTTRTSLKNIGPKQMMTNKSFSKRQN